MSDPSPSFFDEIDEAAEVEADAEGLAELDAGSGVPHEEVRAWLDTSGQPNEPPPPDKWFR